MSNKLKRKISAVLSFVMLVSVMLSSVNVTAYAAEGAKVDVWDFGCVAESDTSIYENRITADVINNCEGIATSGKFSLGEWDFNGLIVNAVANDRMFCEASNKHYGDNAKAQSAYDDGYTANGMWYANGTGGSDRRFVRINDVNAGDEVVIYTGASNAGDMSVHFTCVDDASVQDTTAFIKEGATTKLSFVANASGAYYIWYDKSYSGKPIINRVMRYPATTVTGTISNLSDATTSGCSVVLKNTTTDDSFTVDIPAGQNTFSVKVTPGYKYSATLKGAVGYGFTYATKFVEVPVSAVTTGVNADFTVEPKETYDLSGEINGFAKDYDLSKLTLTLTPDTNDTDTVKADLDGTAFKATLEPDITYTAELGGVNDYEITSGAAFVYSNVTKAEHNITVEAKSTYKVTGDFETSDGATLATGDITALVFTNLDDGYTYSASVNGNSYAVNLRSGEYQASVSSDKYKTSTHVSVKSGSVNRNLYLKEKTVTAPSVNTSVKDIYVGCEGKVNNFETVGEAFAAAAVINPQSEADRVTIHIAPGTYREQTSLNTPYVSLVKEGTGEVVLTWYYGIGYKYYSADNTGYYSDEADFDKYDKYGPSKWGTSTYIKSGAKFFRAEDITFETSFNKYITDEEIIDGVESDGSMSFVRTLGSKVTSKAATERATAISIEADNVEFKDCKFVGSQDTLYMGAPIRAYYKDCVIEGNTDYIFGSGNAVFDGCELRFAGYSDSAVGGYITAARKDKDKWATSSTEFKGYLFRSCTVTNKAEDAYGNTMLSASGYLGRPWDSEATVTYLNTKLEREDAIAAEGWTSMSGVAPEAASYKEYNTTYNGTAVDTSARTSGTVMTAAEAAAVKATDYFGDWTPVFYTEGSTSVDFATVPYFSSTGDVLLPSSDDTLTVKYSLGDNDKVDASAIDWYRVDAEGNETLIKTTSAATEGGNAYKLTAVDEGSFIKAVVTPATVEGVVGTAQSTTTVKTVDKGSGSGVVTSRPSGKAAIFLAGDSTVKDYSAGAINNSTTRTEGSWGEFLGDFVNSNYVVRDYAEGGRSSRTFIDGTKEDGSDRYLDKIKSEMVAGDYLFIQFGHNDSSASYADRYVPVGEADANGVFPVTAPTSDGAGDGTFKWYLQEMVNAALEVGATPVMVTPVSRMYFNADGTIYSHHGSNDEYVIATKQVAEENGIECIDLYTYTKELYEMGYADGGLDTAKALFAKGEKTHHSKIGGFAIAAQMAYELKTNETLGLANAIVTPVSISSVNGGGETEFRVWSDGRFEGYGIDEEGAYDTSIVDDYWTAYINGQLADINNYVVPDKPVVEDMLGDVSGDGILTANDAAFILQYALDPSIADSGEYDFTKADVDGNGIVTANDASYVLQKTLDSSFVFPTAA
jgi:pectin methylesterase-like acyl-CoA thioesterase/lysophospholipase L1-like esterase